MTQISQWVVPNGNGVIHLKETYQLIHSKQSAKLKPQLHRRMFGLGQDLQCAECWVASATKTAKLKAQPILSAAAGAIAIAVLGPSRTNSHGKRKRVKMQAITCKHATMPNHSPCFTFQKESVGVAVSN